MLNSLRENQEGELLALITDRGLFHVNWQDNVLENRLTEMNKQIGSLVLDFYQDKKGIYWFTSTNGLIRISKDGKNLKKYTVKDGLISDNLIRIESSDDKILWISSISGICRFNTETGEVLNYNYNDGLPANEFLERISAKTKDGRIIFGSSAGFTIIDPSKVNPDASKTRIVISDITFQNQSIRSPEGKQFLEQPIEDTKEIWLPYNKNSFSIHYFVKNKSFIKYNNFVYRLTGLEKDWTYHAETNYATYTNLNPGSYTFEIKTDDKTQEGITNPAYHTYSIAMVFKLVFLPRLRNYIYYYLYLSINTWLNRLELRKEKEISEFKIQKEHELTEKKLAFFTSVSHDLKTPLTLIDAPVSDLLKSENLSQDQVKKLMIINRSSKQLYKLITDLLEFRKITQKRSVLEVNETVISDTITDIYEAFKEECENKKIDLKCVANKNLIGFVDAKKIEKILWNLLSNALKFTNKGGTIMLIVDDLTIDGRRNLKFEVRDNGTGIAENEKNKIFERFYKGKRPGAINTEGTGIGLSIVKDLVEIHHGNIYLESVLGEGTTFTIIIPCDRASFSANEIVEHEKTNYTKPIIESNEDLDSDTVRNHRKQYNLPGILVVEDNTELREYLEDHLQKL
ncbi:MAG: hypothetical protein HC831_03760 [Chloroflexia bacterium]|nr:hypothetical protein [Chloroflexia bacterium]